MTRILAKLTLAVFLGALALPCGIVPFHGQSAAAPVPAATHGHSISAHGADAHVDGHKPCAGHGEAAKVCGTDVAVSAAKTGLAFIAAPEKAPQTLVLAAAFESAVDARAAVKSPSIPPPDRDRPVFALTQRLRL